MTVSMNMQMRKTANFRVLLKISKLYNNITNYKVNPAYNTTEHTWERQEL